MTEETKQPRMVDSTCTISLDIACTPEIYEALSKVERLEVYELSLVKTFPTPIWTPAIDAEPIQPKVTGVYTLKLFGETDE